MVKAKKVEEAIVEPAVSTDKCAELEAKLAKVVSYLNSQVTSHNFGGDIFRDILKV